MSFPRILQEVRRIISTIARRRYDHFAGLVPYVRDLLIVLNGGVPADNAMKVFERVVEATFQNVFELDIEELGARKGRRLVALGDYVNPLMRIIIDDCKWK